jgi:hypothetical protein
MRHSVLLLALLLAACSDAKPPEVNLSDALPNIPTPPSGILVTREAGEEAIKIRFRSSEPPERVLEYYREVLSKAPYTLVSDTKVDSSHALYAEVPGKPSLWVTIAPEGTGTLVDVAGAKDRKRP